MKEIFRNEQVLDAVQFRMERIALIEERQWGRPSFPSPGWSGGELTPQELDEVARLNQQIVYLAGVLSNDDGKGPHPRIVCAWHIKVLIHLLQANKVGAIKEVRMQVNLGLKEAKDVIDVFVNRLLDAGATLSDGKRTLERYLPEPEFYVNASVEEDTLAALMLAAGL